MVAIAVGLMLRRRQRSRRTDATGVYAAPTQLDRADFRRPPAGRGWWPCSAPASCTTCADVVRKADVLRSRRSTVVDVEYGADKALHGKYDIDAVPIVVIADADGVVRTSFIGPVTATDLWAAVAEARAQPE